MADHYIYAEYVKGEKFTGYEDGSKGPFACHNCEYFSAGYCRQKIMMVKSRLPRNSAGLVKIDPNGCCEYIERTGGDKDMADSKNWMAKAFPKKNKGKLHEQLGVPKDKKIPKKKLASALAGKYGKLARERAQAAKNANPTS